MLGIKYNIFSRPKTTFDYVLHRLTRFDSRTGLLSAGLPLAIMMGTMITVGTIVIDKQFELRDMRIKSMTNRELQNEREHKMMEKFLRKEDTENYENKPVPRPEEL